MIVLDLFSILTHGIAFFFGILTWAAIGYAFHRATMEVETESPDPPHQIRAEDLAKIIQKELQ